jgi:hypothetical protein
VDLGVQGDIFSVIEDFASVFKDGLNLEGDSKDFESEFAANCSGDESRSGDFEAVAAAEDLTKSILEMALFFEFFTFDIADVNDFLLVTDSSFFEF